MEGKRKEGLPVKESLSDNSQPTEIGSRREAMKHPTMMPIDVLSSFHLLYVFTLSPACLSLQDVCM